MTLGKWYCKAFLNAFGGDSAGESYAIDYLSDDIKVMLCTSSYTPDQDAHEFKSSVTNEVSGTGYTARGQSLANKTLSLDTGTNKIKFDADDVVWSNATITARYAVIYKDTGSDATSLLLGYVDFESNVSSTAAAFTITWDANGIFTITPA